MLKMKTKVIVDNDTHHDVEGKVIGVTLDNYYLIESTSGSRFFAKEKEMKVINESN